METESYEVPDDINVFIQGMEASMRVVVSSVERRLGGQASGQWEVVNDFCVYILGRAPTDSHRLRWARYDAGRHPDVPYHRWFLHQLKLFSLGQRRKVEDDMGGQMLESAYSGIDPCTVVETHCLLEGLSGHLEGMEGRAGDGYRSSVRELLRMVVLECANDEISARLGVSVPTVKKWKARLKNEARTYFKA